MNKKEFKVCIQKSKIFHNSNTSWKGKNDKIVSQSTDLIKIYRPGYKWTFDSRPFMYSKTFLKKLLQNFVVHIFTLLLAPLTSKLVYISRHSEPLDIRKNSEIDDISLR